MESQEMVIGTVNRMAATPDGTMLRAELTPEDGGLPIRLHLHSAPPDLRNVVRQGARIACRAKVEDDHRVAFWVDRVEHEDEDGWGEVWRTGRSFSPNQRSVATGNISTPATRTERRVVDESEREKVWGKVTSVTRLANRATVAYLEPEDGGMPVELQLRRAPQGLLLALTEGARVLCLASPQDGRSRTRFAPWVLRVEMTDHRGESRLVWRPDPTKTRAGRTPTPLPMHKNGTSPW